MAHGLLVGRGMHSVRLAVWGVCASFAIGGVVWVADVLVESDEERIADLADALADDRAEERIDAVLAWVDPTRVPITVRGAGSTERFGADDVDPADAIREALGPLESGSLELIERTIEVEGDRAELALRVRSEGALVDAQIGLRREGQSWLVDEVHRLD